VCSEAANNRWPLISTDIPKAFLQGVTYEELADMTGEPLREVNFYLPAASVEMLEQVPGFEMFDPRAEVLHSDKPGTGSVDAPRAFSIKLQKVWKKECGMKSSHADSELLYLHRNGRLVAISAVHVDDLKMTGEDSHIVEITAKLEKTFGKLTSSGINTLTVVLDTGNAARPLRSNSINASTLLH
jgi:hypothetical protein